ncbi:hypothetical protein SODALDRAFT_358078 [Sodiomyces alkalinus F11]|uniref:Uncharacterized protein n=1 Tax=Sodiomyces alkalinus (strain CBS 110278 / VKM F-3762 / F11) TaxID=1314773 RepID=A0A3N2PYR6_SODAK|nr:hypothetical protein SODALDRAFT_358078 [Sodiomyces alkalinus F11]ROT39669.1 hypothetical protein SODALDRAFT_358078 [Sodiomyces alkalinus F11]
MNTYLRIISSRLAKVHYHPIESFRALGRHQEEAKKIKLLPPSVGSQICRSKTAPNLLQRRATGDEASATRWSLSRRLLSGRNANLVAATTSHWESQGPGPWNAVEREAASSTENPATIFPPSSRPSVHQLRTPATNKGVLQLPRDVTNWVYLNTGSVA